MPSSLSCPLRHLSHLTLTDASPRVIVPESSLSAELNRIATRWNYLWTRIGRESARDVGPRLGMNAAERAQLASALRDRRTQLEN